MSTIDKETQRAEFQAWYAATARPNSWLSWQAAHEQLAERLRVAELDAKRYRWLIGYLISQDQSLDDDLVAAQSIDEHNTIIDAAIAKEKT